MPTASPKFKFLEAAERFLPPGVIPAWTVISDVNSFQFLPKTGKRYILRSALEGEGSQDQLLSGQSLSLASIQNQKDLEHAAKAIFEQKRLLEVILQEEIEWDEHLTVIVDQDFYFAEVKNRSGQVRTFHESSLTRSLLDTVQVRLSECLQQLKPLLQTNPLWLMEWGHVERDSQLYLFQIQTAPREILSTLLNSDMARGQIRSKIRFEQKPSLIRLLKQEWNAYRFRARWRQKNNPTLGDPFQNWEYLFHYFRLFCMIRNQPPDGDRFAEFLSLPQKQSWLGSVIHTHLEIANRLRANESSPLQPTQFQEISTHFIGSGVVTGAWGTEIVFQESLEQPAPERNPKLKAILTSDVSLLSHPVLASIEHGIALVLGIPQELIKNYELGQNVTIDFQNKTIALK